MQIVGLPAELVVQDKIVVRPFETASQGCGYAVHLEILVSVVDLVPIVGIGLTGVVA